MALPKIFQMLFQNSGQGPKLRTDIIPAGITVDNASNAVNAQTALSADEAETAVSAEQDSQGNVIHTTYATKAELEGAGVGVTLQRWA